MTARNTGARSFAISAAILALVILATLAFVELSRPTASPPPDLPASPIVGVVVRVDTESISEVNEIDVRMADGRIVTLSMGPLENATEFSPSHLAEHMATAEPIRAFYRLDAGRPVIYRLEDAAPSPAPSSVPS